MVENFSLYLQLNKNTIDRSWTVSFKYFMLHETLTPTAQLLSTPLPAQPNLKSVLKKSTQC